MYKVTANTRDAYLEEAQKLGRDLKELDDFMRQTVPELQPWFYNVGPEEPGMTFKMLGYGKFIYKPAKKPGATVEWPVVGVALQKNYISMYISVTKDEAPLVDFYAEQLNYTRRGNNNVSFESFGQLDKATLARMLKEAAMIFANDPQNSVRFKEQKQIDH